MRFTKPFSAAALLALLLSGCAGSPPQQASEDTDTGAFNAVLPAGEPTPNPYTRGPHPRVNADTRRQFESAKQAMHRGDWPQAEQLLNAITESQPNLSGAWLNLGIVWRKLGQDDKARAAFEQSTVANPNHIAAYNHLGLLLREQGDFAGAEAAYSQALAVWPFDVSTHRNLGILYDLYLGQWPQA
ncbi:MAG TPA: tetratricopeptide repeat protein, partial [Cellvibrionaceae bacterium]